MCILALWSQETTEGADLEVQLIRTDVASKDFLINFKPSTDLETKNLLASSRSLSRWRQSLKESN